MHACMHACIHTYRHTHTRTHTRTHTVTYTYTYTYSHIHIHIYIHIHIHVHVQSHTHTHVHIQVHKYINISNILQPGLGASAQVEGGRTVFPCATNGTAETAPCHQLGQVMARGWPMAEKTDGGVKRHGYGSIPNTIFRGMNIHLPAILMFTRGTRF